MSQDQISHFVNLDTANTMLFNGLVLFLEQRGLVARTDLIAHLRTYADDAAPSEDVKDAIEAKLVLLKHAEA